MVPTGFLSCSKLDDVDFISGLSRHGPSRSGRSIMNREPKKGNNRVILGSHEVGSQDRVEVLILDADSRILRMFCWTCSDLFI